MEPKYYLLKGKKILRMESQLEKIPSIIEKQLLDESALCMSQSEANMRVVMFRDTIIEYDELLQSLQTI
jgi:hypothetical protein